MSEKVKIDNLPVEEKITDTLEENFMPYAMAVIVSRAIPQIDGFKPSHRKLLYTMYKMGLIKGEQVKSADIVGQTMQLNPHGDIPIYETMVRLARGNESLLHPFVDSKGNFGRVYSRDMSYAASRYTEAKLDMVCEEVFMNIEKENVEFMPNYNNSMMEPVLLPVTYPNVLVTPNTGIAVGMASSICSFNLEEVCEATIALMDDEEADLIKYMPAPDFSTGGEIVYNKKDMEKIYETGRGTFYVRGKYSFDKKNSMIEITEIPYTTTIEAIVDKIIDMAKSGNLREINDVRDETGLEGLKIAIDIKRNADPDVVMQKIFAGTPLTDSFSCNFNILVDGHPRVMGVREILTEWLAFRKDCITRQTKFDLNKHTERLHLLQGLEKIILDIDKAIKIIRETEENKLVVPNLMDGFTIDEEQAEYVAEIRLRNLNKQYLLQQVDAQETLEAEIEELEKLLNVEQVMNDFIKADLERVAEKHGKDRKTTLLAEDKVEEFEEEDMIEDYALKFFLSEESYFKKISLVSLRSSGEQMVKEGDRIVQEIEATNKSELLFFTNQHNVYKTFGYDMEDGMASQLGDYLPSELEMEEDEEVVYMTALTEYKGYMIFAFENGKMAKVDMESYYTKTNRRRLLNAYSDRSPLIFAKHIEEDVDLICFRDTDKAQVINTSLLNSVATRDSVGVTVYNLKIDSVMSKVKLASEFETDDIEEYRRERIPTTGFFLKDQNDQVTLDDVDTEETE